MHDNDLGHISSLSSRKLVKRSPKADGQINKKPFKAANARSARMPLIRWHSQPTIIHTAKDQPGGTNISREYKARAVKERRVKCAS